MQVVPQDNSASEMTYIVSGGALNSTHSLTPQDNARYCHDVIDARQVTADSKQLTSLQRKCDIRAVVDKIRVFCRVCPIRKLLT